MDNVQAPPLLSALSELLNQAAPPSISAVINALENSENEHWFKQLVTEILGPEAGPILSTEDPDERALAFCQHINDNYFPIHPIESPFGLDSLEELDEPVMSWMRYGIIPQVYGVGYEEMHELWTHYEPAFASLGLLCTLDHPYMGDLDEIHVGWMESAATVIPQETLGRLPAKLPNTDVLEEILSGTPHEYIAVAARSLWGNTGNLFVDYSMQDTFEMSMSFNWSRAVVEDLSTEWAEAKKYLDAINRATEWLREDLNAQHQDHNRPHSRRPERSE